MNMKKLVSSVAAFAMTASAFAGLAVTANAAEGDVINNAAANFDDGTNGAFSIDGAAIKDGWLYVPNAAGTLTVADEELAGANDVVVVKFKVAYGKLSRKSFYFSIADSDGDKAADFNFTPYSGTINTNVLGSSENLPGTSDWYYGFNTPLTERSVDYTITLDFANDTITQETTCLKSGTGKAATTATYVNSLPASIDNVKTLTIGSDYNNDGRYCAIDDLSITTTKGAEAATANYTVNYVLPDTETPVKTATLTGVVGEAPVPEMAVFEVDSQRYYCVSNDLAADATIAADGTTVVTVTVRKADVYSVNVATSTGTEIKSGSVVEGDEFTYAFSKYLTDENGKVTASTEETSFSSNITPSENTNITVPYTAYEGVAAFSEMENVVSSTNINDARLSGGTATRNLTGVQVLSVPEDGVYTLTTRAFSNNVNNKRLVYVYANGTEEANLIDTLDLDYKSINSILTQTTESIELHAGDVIYVSGSDSQAAVDYVLIEKTEDLAAEKTLPEVDVTADKDYTQAAGNPARTYLGKFTVGENNYSVSGITWTATQGEKSNTATSTFDTVITNTEVVTGLVVSAESLDGITVTAECIAATAE